MKVYIVTSGCYYDYHIDAVFEDIKKAEIYCAMNPEEDQEIEEWETEDASITSHKPVYKRWVGISQKDGTIEICENGYCLNRMFEVRDVPECYFVRAHRKITMTTSTNKTEEQARKIMFDKLAAWKLEKEMG